MSAAHSRKKKHRKNDPETAPPSDSMPTRTSSKSKVAMKVAQNPKTNFICPPTARWYEILPSLSSPSQTPPTAAQLSTLTQKAADLHAADIQTFQTSSNSSASEAGFFAKIIQSGTLSDKLSALTLLVQSSPVHNLRALENLRGMAERGKGKGGREESLKALRCVVDWWVGGGAPNRKLKYFRDQPLLHPAATDQHQLIWYFEDWLKKYFFSILQILETLSLDSIPYVRTQTLNLISTLLRENPEQEQNLLRLLVNKLGDNEKSLCSRASYHLLQILQFHPAMKSVVVREIVALVLRPTHSPAALPSGTGKHTRFSESEPKNSAKPTAQKNINGHARYYATITFNQIVLTPADMEVALKLIDVYFEMFRGLLGEDSTIDEGGGKKVASTEVKVDKKGRVISHEAKDKSKSRKTGNVTEKKGAAGFMEVEDGQSRLISAILTGVNRALPFAKVNRTNPSINKHIETLFRVTHTSTFNISLQALVLIQQIATALPSTSANESPTATSISDRYFRTLYASLFDTRLASSSKQAMYLNLLFKSIKADVGNAGGERVKALIRRFVQVLVSGGGAATEFTAGGLFLLGELFSTIPGLRALVNKPPSEGKEVYDPRKREPQFAHASSSPLWELSPLLHHYHPAVSLHARQLLSSQPLTASADLSQNTLSHFLDRFVYKNPKKVKVTENGAPKGKGSSAMQPAASGVDPSVGIKLIKGEVPVAKMVNGDAFLRTNAKDVPVDQLFFHKYFARKHDKEQAKAAKVGKRGDAAGDCQNDGEDSEEKVATDGGEADSEQGGDSESDAEEDEVWKAMKASMPKVAGEDDDLMEDSYDEIPSDVDASSDGSERPGGSENSTGGGPAAASDKDEGEDSDENLSWVENSDNEDLIPLDDLPAGLIEYDGADADDKSHSSEDGAWGGIKEDVVGQKRKRDDIQGAKRKKKKALPTFASYEDYAKMIEDGPEDDI